MLRFIISTLLVCCFLVGNAQSKPIDTKPTDTVIHKQAYGLRIGVDLSRPTISFFEEEYTGLEFVGDYRLSQKYFAAAEIGNEKRSRQEDLYNFTASGSYIKLGIDYNTYANWYGEQNLIYVGGRYAFSTFSQTINDYQIFNTNRYWNPDSFAEGANGSQEFTGLSAHWLEFVLGVKAELFANIYLGGSIRMGILVANNDPDNFKNLFIPGFNKVTDGSSFGVGYNFSISYFLPFYKKAKKPKKKASKPQPEQPIN